MSVITDRLQLVKNRINTAAQNAARNPANIRLLAVSKTQTIDAILEAVSAGQFAFGENYEQEAIEKINAIQKARPDLKLEWHFIGPIQSNKTKAIASHFDWVHSVDREKIARRLSDQRPANLPPLNICLQINISGEASKSGIPPEKLPELAKAVSTLPNLKLRGLMAIPQPESDPEKQKKPFKAMKGLFDALRKMGLNLDTLSMGMSDDMNTAICEGATLVRIGTAIFGQRIYAPKKK